EPPIVEVLPEHRVEMPAAVFVKQVPVIAPRYPAEDPGRANVGAEVGGTAAAVEAGGVDDPGHGPGTRPGDHVHDDALLFEGLQHAEVGHSAGGPAAPCHPDPPPP